MRHRFLTQLGPAAGESDQDDIRFPKGWKSDPKISENPAGEMARLIREIAGTATAGETDEQLRMRAARRLGISASRAKVFWYAETENIKSEEMDRARLLAAAQPIEEAIDAVERAELWIESLAVDGCLSLADRILAGLLERLSNRAADARLHTGSGDSLDAGRPRARLAADRQGGASAALARRSLTFSRRLPPPASD